MLSSLPIIDTHKESSVTVALKSGGLAAGNIILKSSSDAGDNHAESRTL